MYLQASKSQKVYYQSEDESGLVFSGQQKSSRDVSADSESEHELHILVVDRDSMSSHLLANVLATDERFRASAVSSSELIHMMASGNIDLLIIGADLTHGAGNGFDLAHDVHQIYPDVRILMILNQSTFESVVRAFQSGANGVVSRERAMDELLDCIGHVQNGCIGVGVLEAGFLLQAVRALPMRDLLDSNALLTLSDRELQVVRHAATGKTNKMIASELRLSEHTVKNYLFRAFEKLGVSSRVELLFVLTQCGHSLGFAVNEIAAKSSCAPISEVT